MKPYFFESRNAFNRQDGILNTSQIKNKTLELPKVSPERNINVLLSVNNESSSGEVQCFPQQIDSIRKAVHDQILNNLKLREAGINTTSSLLKN